MEVILLERIEKLGQMGDVVKVRPGFARNYLLPQKKALRASKANMAIFEQQRAQLEAENLQRRKEAESVASKIDGMSIVIIRQAGDSGQLYGSVSTRDVAEGVTSAGATIDRNQVILDKPIKMLGLHDVRIRLHPEVAVSITVNVARTEAEAEVQTRTGRFVDPEEQRAAEEATEAQAMAKVEALETDEEGLATEAVSQSDGDGGIADEQQT